MKETAPLWSIRGRTSYVHKEEFPGPGSYSPTNSMMHTSPNYRVGTAPRKSVGDSSLTPGPGAYSPPVATDTPRWTMYDLSSSGRAGKADLSRSLDTPGPGTYRVARTQESPRYSVGKSVRSSLEGLNRNPGPGTYNPGLIGFKGNNLFSKSSRASPGNGSGLPGPGGYEFKSFIVEGPRYTFRPRLKQKVPYDVPGPGKYEPNHSTVLDKAPIWGPRAADRNQDFSPVRNNPGPGTYNKSSTLEGPKWGFGSSKRGKTIKLLSPGPGTYEIRSSIGAAPSYIQTSNEKLGVPVEVEENVLRASKTVDYNDFTASAKPADLRLAQLFRDETCFRRFQDEKWQLFPIWSTSLEELGQFGSGIELYLKLVRTLAASFFVISCISIYPIWVNSQQDGLTAGDVRQRWDTWAVSNLDVVLNQDDQDQNKKTLFWVFITDAVYTSVFLASVIYLFWLSNSSVKKNFEKNVTLADYSVEVKGLPEFGCDGQRVRNHFEKFGDVHEVYLGRKYDGILRLYRERAELSNQLAYLNLLKDSGREKKNKIEEVLIKLQRFDEKIKLKEKKSARVHDDLPVIRGFVVFSDFSARKNCIDAYKKDETCCKSLKNQSRSLKFEEKFPLIVSTTAAPANIIYENLEVSRCSRFIRRLVSLFSVLVALLASVSMVYGLKLYQDDLPSDEKCAKIDSSLKLSEAKSIYTQDTEKYCYCKRQSLEDIFNDSDMLDYCDYFFERIAKSVTIRVCVSFGVVFINFIIKVIFRLLGRYERVHNRSTEQLKLMSKVFVATFINTALVVLAVNADFSDMKTETWMPEFLFNSKFSDFSRQWYVQVGSTLVSTMIISIFSPHIFILATFYPLGLCKRNCCISGYLSQAEANEKFSGAYFELATRNSFVLTLVFTCFLYSGGMPIMNVICFLSLFTLYWSDKFLLLRHYKRPALINHYMNERVLQYLPSAAIFHCCFSLYMYGSSDIFPYHVNDGMTESNSLIERIRSVTGMVFIVIGIVAAVISVWIFFHAKVLGCSMKKIVRVSDENATERKIDKEISNIRSHGLDTYDILKNPEYRDVVKSINAAAAKHKGTQLSFTSIGIPKSAV